MFNYKIAILGDKGVGKTTFLNYFKNIDGIIQLQTSIGKVKLNCVITDKVDDSYTGIIIMVNQLETSHIMYCLKLINLPKIPIIVCVTKSDIKGSCDTIIYDVINFYKRLYKNVETHVISSNNFLNVYDPFLSLIRTFNSSNEITFVEEKKKHIVEISDEIYNLIKKSDIKNITVSNLLQIFEEVKSNFSI
jgi:GTPase SAR1 family protein